MFNGNISNQNAEGITFEVFDVLTPKREFSKIEWFVFAKALYRPFLMRQIIKLFYLHPLMKSILSELSKNHNLYFILMGKNIEGVITDYFDELGIVFSKIKACETRYDLDWFMEFYQIKYYFNNAGKDIFDRVIPGIMSLKELKLGDENKRKQYGKQVKL